MDMAGEGRSARRWVIPTAMVVTVLLGGAAAATVQTRAFKPLRQALAAVTAPQAAVEPRYAVRWVGADLDGDGAADVTNPTGQAPRAHDVFGDGAFGASRDGGSRDHEGVDYLGEAGQPVRAPVSGYVTKIGYAYPGAQDLQFVEITNPAIGYAARVFYIEPGVELGQAIRMGQPVGVMTSLQRRYPGISDHVHLEMIKAGERVDATRLITARRVRLPDEPVLAAAE
ncbi:M23 family metallopeptidase [Caulobacter sp. NIBR2454]|uniref:M23 family metallopeptidase n=1 Tax=Caulobacter sp. NIBR2454 TaxID=3015996 RepID=UPI0022B5F6EE|nr:M23 family metallopeptidase [Caulobacter sp. NIBR2454]